MKILGMSGFVPEQICDTLRFTGYAGERNLSQYCGYASDYISQVRQDESIDGAVFPRSCDSSRILKSYLEDIDKFIYQLSVPARQDQFAVEYFAADIKNYKKALEEFYNIVIYNIPERIDAVNIRNAALKKLYDHVEDISYYEYLEGIHRTLASPLLPFDCRILEQDLTGSRVGKRVYLVGSFLSNRNIVKYIEEAGMNIVGDNLPESGRLSNQPPTENQGDRYLAIAKSILSTRLSPSQDNFKAILERDAHEMENKSVEGVIYISQKYCEPYDFLFSVYRKMLDEKEIPIHKIELINSEDDRNVRLGLEAFADII